MNQRIPFLYKGCVGFILQTEELISGNVTTSSGKNIVLFGETVSAVSDDLKKHIDHYFQTTATFNWFNVTDISSTNNVDVSYNWEGLNE